MLEIEIQIERYPTSVFRAVTIGVVSDKPPMGPQSKCAGLDGFAIPEYLGPGVPLDLEHVRSGHGLRHNGRRTLHRPAVAGHRRRA